MSAMTGRDPAGAARVAVKLVDATAWPADRWDALAVQSPLGHVFQAHAGGGLKRRLGWTPVRVVVETEGAPVAVLQALERPVGSRLPGHLGHLRYLYAPRGPILLRPNVAAATAALAGARHLAHVRDAAVLTVDPAWEEGGPLAGTFRDEGFAPAPREIQVSRTAMVVPVAADDAGQHALLGDSTARNVNRARRAGVTVEHASPGEGADRGLAIALLWDALAATARRDGFPLRDRAYIVEQIDRLGAAGWADLWLARASGSLQAAVVTLRCGEQVVSYLAGSPDGADLRHTCANHLLQWEILRWAAGAGFRSYDLGGVDTHAAPGLPTRHGDPLWNLYEFKRGFGAQPILHVRAHDHAPNAAFGAVWRLARRAP
jgi:lipid II:glycine glycyltransferase (peptidoglycan interpeptide bridge formation enzyme)